MTLTKTEMQQLTDEFVQFQINEMTREEMASYVYNSMRQEIICQRTHLPLNESLKLQIDEYDENLYDILLSYIRDEENSYEALCEYQHDLQENNFWQPLKCNPIEHTNKMESYLNLFEQIPEDEHSRISNMIWEALDRAGIELSQDAELSIRIYDDEYEGEYDGQEYDE